MTVKRGDLYLASLDPAVGREIRKTRPVVIVSNDVGNRFAGTVTVVPVTSQGLQKIYPFEAFLPVASGLEKDSKAKADQVRTLDKSRLAQKLGALDDALMRDVDRALRIHLDL